jgi:tRNA-splicing ligase RtcB
MTTGVDTITGGRIPVLSWASPLEDGAAQQARNCADLPVAYHHVAVMADGHQGYGVPIGAVLALDGAISPYAVGNDIGCGMALVPTHVPIAEFAPVRDDVMGWVQTMIPAGVGKDRGAADAPAPDIDKLLDEAWDAMDAAGALREPRDRVSFVRRGRSQAGTLGAGNHFVELLRGPDDNVWIMLHSGSRGTGGTVCENFHRLALAHCADAGHALPDPGLAWLPIDSDAGRCYERALRAALEYAERNRHRMLEVVARELESRFPDTVDWDRTVNIHHNDATLEEHYGKKVWVHRKGAVKAGAGTATITPGSMGTGSYLGRGRGNAESYSSCSHGAGRALSRGAARRQLALDEQLALVAGAGGKVFASSKEAVLDEMPGAYKDLDAVMRNQADLVEAVAHLTPLATYKGADPPRRRGKKKEKKGWHPEEER